MSFSDFVSSVFLSSEVLLPEVSFFCSSVSFLPDVSSFFPSVFSEFTMTVTCGVPLPEELEPDACEEPE